MPTWESMRSGVGSARPGENRLRWGAGLVVWMVLVLAAGARGQVAGVQPLTPGVYGPYDLGMQQWTYSLQQVSTNLISGDQGMTGAAISNQGLLLTEASISSTAEMLALGQNGAIVHSIGLGQTALDRGSGIVVQPGTGEIYASDGSNIVQISPDFSTISDLPVTLGRAAGLALGPDGATLYAVDQDANQIDVMNLAGTISQTIPTGKTPIGLAFGPDGALYYTDLPEVTGGGVYLSQLVRVDVANGDAQTLYAAGLPFMGDIDFAPDGSFYLGENSGRTLAHYAFDGELLQTVNSPGTTDGVAVVPEPALTGLVAVAGMIFLGRRSRGRSIKRQMS